MRRILLAGGIRWQGDKKLTVCLGEDVFKKDFAFALGVRAAGRA